MVPPPPIHPSMEASQYSERQEDEIEFLQAVFPAGELEDLRLKDPWKVSGSMECMVPDPRRYV